LCITWRLETSAALALRFALGFGMLAAQQNRETVGRLEVAR